MGLVLLQVFFLGSDYVPFDYYIIAGQKLMDVDVVFVQRVGRG